MSTAKETALWVRRYGGYFRLNRWRGILIKGVDAAAFLQTRFSNDVKALSTGQGQLTTLLDRRAHVLAFLSLHRLDDHFLAIVDSADQQALLLEELEKYHFNEKVTFEPLAQSSLWSVQGPRADHFITAGSSTPKNDAVMLQEHGACRSDLYGHEVTLVKESLTAESGFILVCKEQEDALKDFEAAAQRLELIEAGDDALDILRVEAGLLKFGIDFNNESPLPETGLENVAASYSKGCFQGQEVLARVRTFGAPRRGMIGLKFEGLTQTFPIGTTLYDLNGNEVGTLVSNVFSPALECTIAFAYLVKEQRVPDREIEVIIDDKPLIAKVQTLPFYSGTQRLKQAKSFYDRALQEFANGGEALAIDLLMQTIELAPAFADAYEVLGVMLSKRDRLDEAIELMKTLEELEPDSIMAHTNLSVFYMQQGNKELAEEEKARAMSIQMSKLARQYSDEQKEREEAARRKNEAVERMALFKQVLEIDAEDFLANSGIGGALVDMEMFDEALPYLEKALSVKSNHTLTYKALGLAYERLGRLDQALDTYRKGIAMASQRGEMTPLKDMQVSVQRLSKQVGHF